MISQAVRGTSRTAFSQAAALLAIVLVGAAASTLFIASAPHPTVSSSSSASSSTSSSSVSSSSSRDCISIPSQYSSLVTQAENNQTFVAARAGLNYVFVYGYPESGTVTTDATLVTTSNSTQGGSSYATGGQVTFYNETYLIFYAYQGTTLTINYCAPPSTSNVQGVIQVIVPVDNMTGSYELSNISVSQSALTTYGSPPQ
jgi:hypothetical protein